MLDAHQVKSTFFVPGAVAEKYTEQVRMIHERGHELACHATATNPSAAFPERKRKLFLTKAKRL